MKITQIIQDTYGEDLRETVLQKSASPHLDETLSKILNYFNEWKKICKKKIIGEDRYSFAHTLLKETAYTPQEIITFFIRYQKEIECMHADVGIFFSALVNRAQEKSSVSLEYSLHTEEFNFLIDYIGYNNNGSAITVNGPVGNRAGIEMMKGVLHLRGNAETSLGALMKDGEIFVYGNVKDYCGTRMKGGIIHIKGNAGGCCGNEARGGKIIVEGTCGKAAGCGLNGGTLICNGFVDTSTSFGFYKKGEVYVRGTLLRGLNEEI